MGSVEQTMKNFLYSLFIGLFGIAALTSIAFLLMYMTFTTAGCAALLTAG